MAGREDGGRARAPLARAQRSPVEASRESGVAVPAGALQPDGSRVARRADAGNSLRGAWLTLLPLAAYTVAVFARGYERILGFLEDDAAYYFVVAENIVRNGRSTFDGVTTTTGYHPLWLGVNVALAWATGLNRKIYIYSLIVVCALLAQIYAVVLHRFLTRLRSVPVVVDVVVILVVARSFNLDFSGMECALTLPLMAWCALETIRHLDGPAPPPGRFALLGVLAAATALSRIDALPFGLACGALLLLSTSRGVAPTVQRAGAFALGLLPIMGGYFLMNYALTGSPMTTSAMAKSLGSGLGWNTKIMECLTRGDKASLFVSCAGLLLVSSRWSPWSGGKRMLAIVITGFPIAYYGLLTIKSSWEIWGWYTYPLPLAVAVTVIAVVELWRERATEPSGILKRLQPYAIPAALAVSMLLVFKSARSRGNNEGTLHATSALSEFVENHPGRYGMGDRAGLTAFLIPRSFLQLEGLVADRALLDAIRERRDLRRTLVSYGVDYLVEAVPTSSLSGSECQDFTEPKVVQAGERSPKMRGRFCSPLFRFDDATDDHTTLVYRVAPD
jgi:hypothetical protein